MKVLIKDSENKVKIIDSIDGFIPPGYTLVAEEEVEAEKLNLAKSNKLAEIRAKRDEMLSINDKLWLIASKKAHPTTSLETDAETLRDLPELAQSELDALETVEEVQAYDCFVGLALTGDYE